MADASLYPLDYQLTLGRIIRERLALLRAKGAEAEAARMQDALARLHASDFGACVSCGRVIAYLEITADPAARRCADCRLRSLNLPHRRAVGG